MKTSSIVDEKELLRRLQNGDQMAFQMIYERYAPRLATKLVQLLRSEELAQDILQDIFIKIWEVRADINLELSFVGLLYKMAANLSKNAFRKSLYNEKLHADIVADEGYNPIEDALNQSDAKALLENALSHLTPRQREVYVMHKLEGRSYQEIMTMLHISSSAINQHIQEAGKKLKLVLKNHYLELFIIVLPTFLKK